MLEVCKWVTSETHISRGNQSDKTFRCPWIKKVKDGKTEDYGLNDEGVLCYRGRFYVPNDKDLKQTILREVQASPYAIQLGDLYWWPELKRDVTELVDKCLMYNQVKAKH
ncbi:zinc finger and BTB domain-containing protein 11-like [Gossypium australe]|uniref:Zinc finger and BTB domain-containing protein 11-like n=1 Tax=Gossypium australe TaxID=47621 RepID=A0A5B6VXH1_9ROSI|nr:zinc finger and BTB domain-containing protein 11-like [Gossypium australe]